MTPTSPWARGHIQGRAGGGTMGTPRLGAPVGMNRVWGRLAGALVVAVAAVAIMGSAPHLTISELHVCADPYNMPFSDDHEQGFENKIANVVARYTKRSEEHTSELQSPCNLVCRLLLEK